MSDDETPETTTPGEPGPVEAGTDPTAEVPSPPAPDADVTERHEAVVIPPPDEPLSDEPPRADPPAPDDRRRGVFVPGWAMAVLALVVVAALGFGVGRWTDDDDGHRDDRFASLEETGRRVLPELRERLEDRMNDRMDERNGPQQQPRNQMPMQGGAYLGVGIENSTSPAGARVVSVTSGSPAANAGLRSGDVITEVDGDDVNDAAALREAIQSHDSGDQVTIRYTRNGASSEVRVRLGSSQTSSLPAS